MESTVPILFFGGIAALIIAAFFVSRYFKKKRRLAIASIALRHQLSFTPHDPFLLTVTYDFNLFKAGDGRGAENVITGQWKDRRVIAADYWYYTESSNGKGGRSRSYKHFQVAIVPIGAYLPPVQIKGENVLTLLADHIGMEDINFESEEFNRTFNVKAHDRQFAFKLIDPRMMQWLLHVGRAYSYETSGSDLLVFRKRSKPHEIPILLDVADQTIDRIPRLVWEDYQVKGAS